MPRKGNLTIRTSGVVITTPHDGGPVLIQDCVQCCHCQGHRIYVPGSKTKWGWCLACAGVHCATEACAKCVPWEKELEAIEAGKTPEQMPVKIAVPRTVGE